MNAADRQKFVLTVSCPEANGIVRAVSDFLFQRILAHHGLELGLVAGNRNDFAILPVRRLRKHERDR